MFTGIVTDIGTILSLTPQEGCVRMRLQTHYDPASFALGASLACAGVCLTIVEIGDHWVEMDIGLETLAVTHAVQWRTGTKLNLERALKMGDELGGHLVTGHVDGLARIVERRDQEGMVFFAFDAPPKLARFIAVKGSVTLDGTSLTVNHVEGSRFDALLIPHTLQVTTWGERRVGDDVNLEVDLMARYAARWAEMR